MFLRFAVMLAGCLAIVSCMDTVSTGAVYIVTDIGEIPGNTGQILVNGMNARGDIVGSYRVSGITQGFVWTFDHGLQTLTAPGADRSSAEGINDLGQVVGYARLPARGYNNHAFLWDPCGTAQDIAPTAQEAYAYDINNQGQVVGAVKMSVDRRPYVWTEDAGITELSEYLGNAFAISPNGNVTGGWQATISSSERAFRWESSTGLVDVPGGGGWSRGNAVNDSGWVLGFGLVDSTTVPMLWTPEGGVEYIGGTSGGWGYGINSAGTALIATEGSYYLWNRGKGLTDLAASLVDLPSGWRLLSARTINDAGMIAGTAGTDPTHAHLVLLAPVSEPSILRFFDNSVANGALTGSGPGSSAQRRLNALRNMIEAAGDLIRDGSFEQAIQQLQGAYDRCDGLPRPPDFVQGAAAATLAEMIDDLITQLDGEL